MKHKFTKHFSKYSEIDIIGTPPRKLPASIANLGFDEFNVDQQISFDSASLEIEWTLDVQIGKASYEIYHVLNRIKGTITFEGIDLERPFDKEADLVKFEVDLDLEEYDTEWTFSEDSEDVKLGSGVIHPQSVEIDFKDKIIRIKFDD